MTGETESGIVFGAEILADEAEGGEGGEIGQTEGEVFVSGAFGTLTYGDTDGADLYHVGDLNEVGLTGLGDENETPFISERRRLRRRRAAFRRQPVRPPDRPLRPSSSPASACRCRRTAT